MATQFQQTGNVFQAPGRPGAIQDISPNRTTPHIVVANGDNLPEFGRAFTLLNPQTIQSQPYAQVATAQIGGTGRFAGILVNPGEYISYAPIGEATYTLPDGAEAGLCSMGHVWVIATNEITNGYLAAYDTTTGEIYGYAQGTEASALPSGQAFIPNATLVKFNSVAGNYAVLEMVSY